MCLLSNNFEGKMLQREDQYLSFPQKSFDNEVVGKFHKGNFESRFPQCFSSTDSVFMPEVLHRLETPQNGVSGAPTCGSSEWSSF